MKSVLWVCLYILFVFCFVEYKSSTENELTQYTKIYYTTFGGKKFEGPIYISNTLDEGNAGECINHSSIKIDVSFWKGFSSYAKEELMFHELSHCIHHLHHDDTFIKLNGKLCPKSIMNSEVNVGGPCYINNREYYINELKERINK